MNEWTTQLTPIGVMLFALALGACVEPVVPNVPPEFASLPGELRVEAGAAVEFTVTAADPDGGSVTVSMESAPPGAEFIGTGALGRFFWAPLASDAQAEAYEVRFVAEDARGSRTTVRVRIFVEASDGRPRSVTALQRVLDLSETDTMVVELVVKDDDSSQVSMNLEEAPRGMTLTQLGDKRGELVWTPSPEQISTQSVWTATLVLDDGDTAPVRELLSVILIAKNNGDGCQDNGCGCDLPQIDHDELGEQRGADNYEVIATITDAQSRVEQATLFFTTGDPEDLNTFDSVEMSRDGDTFRGDIPNPRLNEGESAGFFYVICGVDGDVGDDGQSCQNLRCAPEKGRYSFAAFAPGDTETCRQDEHEPDDTPGQSDVTTDDRQVFGATLCDDDVDFWAVELVQGASFGAVLRYTSEHGNMRLRLLDEDGSTVLQTEDTPTDDELLTFGPVDAAQVVFIEVSGEPNIYDLTLSLVEPADPDCEDDAEPNDDADTATFISSGTLDDLRFCGGDRDFYTFTVGQGQAIEARIDFEHDEGDLDLVLYAPDGQTNVDSSLGVGDSETVRALNTEFEGDYLLEIKGFNGNNNNRYSLVLSVSDQLACVPDTLEPNDDSEDASLLNDGESLSLQICAEDIDYFAIELEAGQRARVSVIHDPAQADIDVYFLDTDALEPLAEGTTLDPIETVAATAPADGVYFVEVLGFQSEDVGPYNLTLELCQNDLFDPNDSAEDASRLLSGLLDDLRLCLQETDWYAVTGLAGETLLVSVTSDQTEELTLTLMDSTRTNIVATGIIEGNELFVREPLNEGGDYFISVGARADASDDIGYQLFIDNQSE